MKSASSNAMPRRPQGAVKRNSFNDEPPANGRDEIGRLLLNLLYWLYEEANHKRAATVARRLEGALKGTSEDSIRIAECRSLIAEVRGDLGEAIRHRVREIDMIRRLHALSLGKPGEAYVFRAYGYRDLSDRLDLFAMLLHNAGQLDRALEVLEESRRLCKSHRFKFDGDDLLRDYRQERRNNVKTNRRSPIHARHH